MASILDQIKVIEFRFTGDGYIHQYDNEVDPTNLYFDFDDFVPSCEHRKLVPVESDEDSMGSGEPPYIGFIIHQKDEETFLKELKEWKNQYEE